MKFQIQQGREVRASFNSIDGLRLYLEKEQAGIRLHERIIWKSIPTALGIIRYKDKGKTDMSLFACDTASRHTQKSLVLLLTGFCFLETA